MYKISTTSLQSIYAPSAKTKSGDGSKVSFNEYLDSAIEETEEISSVPTDWAAGGIWYLYDSLTAVREYMRNELGIDPDDRTFTHEITEEQREWLASRHDMDAVETATVGSEEFANFMADLYYLGVFSSSDVMNFERVDIPTENGLIYLGKDWNYTSPDPNSSAVEYTLGLIEYESRLLDCMEDSVERQRFQDSINYRQELNDVLQNIFNSF